MWPDLAIALLMMVVSAAIQAVTRPKIDKPNQDPSKLDIPTAEEGRPIPVIFGTCLIKNPNVVWYGDADTTPIKTEGSGKK